MGMTNKTVGKSGVDDGVTEVHTKKMYISTSFK